MTKTFPTKYPDVTVQLLGMNFSIFTIESKVVTALRKGLKDEYSIKQINDIVDAYREEIKDNKEQLLRISMSYVTVY